MIHTNTYDDEILAKLRRHQAQHAGCPACKRYEKRVRALMAKGVEAAEAERLATTFEGLDMLQEGFAW